MPRKPSRRGRITADDSDSEGLGPTMSASEDALEQARTIAKQNLMMYDLCTQRADQMTSSDRPQRMEDRANVMKLLQDRDVNAPGTEAHALYSKNKAAINAWSNPANVVDNHEEEKNPLDGGNSHRQRIRNLYGGRIEEPNDYEAGYAPAARGGYRGSRAGGSADRVGRPQVSTSAPVRDSSHRDFRPPPIPPINSRPLDPAIDPDDPRSKYRSSRGGSSGGRGGGNVGRGRGLGHASVGPRIAPISAQPARAARTTPTGTIDMLADSALFMRAVAAQMNKTVAKPEATGSPSTSKSQPKDSTTTIKSKWGGPNPFEPASAAKNTRISSISPVAADNKSNIRQVPTNEFVLPPPHRGDTESWTDGVQSTRLSTLESPAASQSASPSPYIAPDSLAGVGLGISNVDSSMEVYTATDTGDPGDVVDLMDITDYLSALNDVPVTRARLSERIVVNGAIYILDKSALGNAVLEPDAEATTAPRASVRPQRERTSAAAHRVRDGDAQASSITVNAAPTIDSHRVAAASGTQTTLSLTRSQWATAAPSTLFRPQVNNPFASGDAPPRSEALVQSPGEFAAYIMKHPREVVSSILTISHGDEQRSITVELTSPERLGSIVSTPSVSSNVAASRWGRPPTQVVTNTSTRVFPSVPAAVDGDVSMTDTVINDSEPRRIDNLDLVRLQAVGDASFGMTPFQSTAPAPSIIDVVPSRPTNSSQQPTTTSIGSNNNASTTRRGGLNASKYSSNSAAASSGTQSFSTLQPLSLNTTVPANVEFDTRPKSPTTRAAFGTTAKSSFFASNNENAPPARASTTSTLSAPLGPRIGWERYHDTRTSATGIPYGLSWLQPRLGAMQTPNLVPGPLAGSAPVQLARVFTSTTTTSAATNQPNFSDDDCDSEL